MRVTAATSGVAIGAIAKRSGRCSDRRSSIFTEATYLELRGLGGGKLAVIGAHLVQARRRRARAGCQSDCCGCGRDGRIEEVHGVTAFGERVQHVLRRAPDVELRRTGLRVTSRGGEQLVENLGDSSRSALDLGAAAVPCRDNVRPAGDDGKHSVETAAVLEKIERR